MPDNVFLMYRKLPVNLLREIFIEETIMKWPLSSPDLNPIKNLWSDVKMKLYEGGKQYNIKADLWEEIKTAKLEIELAEVKN